LRFRQNYFLGTKNGKIIKSAFLLRCIPRFYFFHQATRVRGHIFILCFIVQPTVSDLFSCLHIISEGSVVTDFKNWPALGSGENGEADHGG
jgi:hypothetical protein